MVEARRAERVRTLLGAQIMFNNRSTTVECQVRNISATGAKLAVTKTVTLPDTFELHIPQKHKTQRVRLRWRYEDAVGVAFIDENQESGDYGSGTGLRPPAPNGDAERIAVLEKENAELREEVSRLNRKLEILRLSESGPAPLADPNQGG